LRNFLSGLFSLGSPLGLLLRELKTAWPFPLQVAYEKLRKSCGVFLLGMVRPNFAFSHLTGSKLNWNVLEVLPVLTTKISWKRLSRLRRPLVLNQVSRKV
jgi:hypothetical protein